MAQALWPSITLVESGCAIDKAGVDAYDDTCALQIKYDETMARTGKIYHEIYEKSINRPSQHWRNSPHRCDAYIFCTNGYAIRISVNALAEATLGRKLVKISNTSMGFLIPQKELDACNYERQEG